MGRLAGVAFTGAVALLAVAVVGAAVGRFGTAVDLTVALLGGGLLVGCLLSLAEAGQRVHQLARFALAAVHDGRDVAGLESGTRWLRVEADVTAEEGAVRGVLDDDPAVAVTVVGDVRERFAGLPWPSTRVGARFERTDAVRGTLDPSVAAVTLATAGDPRTAGHDVRVVGGTRREVRADDDVSDHTRNALAEHDVDVETDVARGRAFEHHVRITEATVPDGGTVRLFSPVTVESGADGPTLTPAGRFAVSPLMTAAGWEAVPRRILRRLGTFALVAPLTGAGGLLLLWFSVPSLVG